MKKRNLIIGLTAVGLLIGSAHAETAIETKHTHRQGTEKMSTLLCDANDCTDDKKLMHLETTMDEYDKALDMHLKQGDAFAVAMQTHDELHYDVHKNPNTITGQNMEFDIAAYAAGICDGYECTADKKKEHVELAVHERDTVGFLDELHADKHIGGIIRYKQQLNIE